MKKRIVVLASGGGSNLQALLDAMLEDDYPAQCVLVLSNKEGAPALEKARAAGVEAHFLDPLKYENKEAYDKALAALVHRAHPDFVCLAGYMRILQPVFIQAFSGKILNIHPSLLPKHGGEGMFGKRVHESVLQAGESVSGATVHWVTNEVDGGAVILQGAVPVEGSDTAQTLAQRVLALEHRLYAEALRRVCSEKA